MQEILSYGCRFNNLKTEITIEPLNNDLTGYETTLKKEFIRKISFDYYSNVYIIKGYYPNNDVDECFKGVELERWASLKNNHKDAVKKVNIRWVRGKHVDREIGFNGYAIKYKEEIDKVNHHFYLLLVDVDKEREIGYNNTITVNNSDLLYITMKPYVENKPLNSVLRKLDNKYISISDLKGNYALLNNLAKTKIATKRSITSEEYWKIELMVSSLTTEFKSVFFKLNINFNKAGYDGLVNNGRPLNILRRIISILGRHISSETIKDLNNIKKNLDTKKVLLSRQLKEKAREIIKKEDLIIQPRLNSIRVCKNNNGGGTGMTTISQKSEPRIKWGEEVDTGYSRYLSQRNGIVNEQETKEEKSNNANKENNNMNNNSDIKNEDTKINSNDNWDWVPASLINNASYINLYKHTYTKEDFKLTVKDVALTAGENFLTRGWHWAGTAAKDLGKTALQKGKAGYSLTLGDTEEVFGVLIELGKNDYKEKKDYLCGRDVPQKADYMIVVYRKVSRGSADYIDNSFIKLDTTEFYYKNGDRINHIDDVDGVDGFTGIDSFFNFFDLQFNQGIWYPNTAENDLLKNEAEKEEPTKWPTSKKECLDFKILNQGSDKKAKDIPLEAYDRVVNLKKDASHINRYKHTYTKEDFKLTAKDVAMAAGENFLTRGWHWIVNTVKDLGKKVAKTGQEEFKLTLGDTEEIFGGLIELGKNDYKEKEDYLCGRDIPQKADYMIVSYKKVTRGSADYIDNSFVKLDTVEFYYKNGDKINHIVDVDGVDGFTGIDSFFNFFDLQFNQGIWYPNTVENDMPENEADEEDPTKWEREYF